MHTKCATFFPHPARKNGRGRARHSSPHPSCRARPLHAPSGAKANQQIRVSDRNPTQKQRREATPFSFRIFREKSSNFNQKAAQFRRKLKIIRKRGRKNTKWRARRHSPPNPSCRLARIFVGRFGNFGHKCKRCARRKNEGAVACREKR